MKRLAAITAIILFTAGLAVSAQATGGLKLVAEYKMPATVKGHFDHLAPDLRRNRLFVTAETAHEVLVFNLSSGQYLRAITGIEKPHAVFVRPDLDGIYITDGGAGELKIYNGKTYRLLGSVKLKLDADSIGYDPATHDLYIDNGGEHAHESFSMLSVVDTTADKKVADIRIDGDTLEAMALARTSPLLYVNNPAKNQVDVVNRKTRSVIATWPVTMGKKNVAIALDEPAHRLFVACRSGVIVVFDTATGKELQSLPIGGDVDDLIFDLASRRLYAACGSGQGTIAVYHQDSANHYTSLGLIPSGPHGKNIVLVPRLGRLFITIPPQATSPGEVYVYRIE